MAAERTESKTILLTGPITLYEVSAVRETLRMALAEGKRLRIDLSDSGPWDLAGLQLLISCGGRAGSRSNGTPGQRSGGVHRDRRAIRFVGLVAHGPGVRNASKLCGSHVGPTVDRTGAFR